MTTGYVVHPAGPEHVDRLPDIELEAATRFGDTLPESLLSHVTPADSLMAAQQAGLLWVALEPAGAPVGFAVASIRGRVLTSRKWTCCPSTGARG